ncbi:phage baseplate assembly protein W [Azospirillum fermentarium]|uniref:GPW/gp25 family protein n=1 Tax=Azospirillum fermentarium TaxID=1233114 RepID=UPI0022266766|nr:GPW/gp25 family protein [Azospirillum fermentarium]MCW2248294.1 phage baseplate assembly protein W [Azospirillum fermentarium]
MQGMNAVTGGRADGVRHLLQSIRAIITTPIGTRIHRRDFGSRVPFLIDAPINAATIIEIYAGVAEALDRWEPRFALSRIILESAAPGRVEMTIEGIYRPENRDIRMEGIIV